MKSQWAAALNTNLLNFNLRVDINSKTSPCNPTRESLLRTCWTLIAKVPAAEKILLQLLLSDELLLFDKLAMNLKFPSQVDECVSVCGVLLRSCPRLGIVLGLFLANYLRWTLGLTSPNPLHLRHGLLHSLPSLDAGAWRVSPQSAPLSLISFSFPNLHLISRNLLLDLQGAGEVVKLLPLGRGAISCFPDLDQGERESEGVCPVQGIEAGPLDTPSFLLIWRLPIPHPH